MKSTPFTFWLAVVFLHLISCTTSAPTEDASHMTISDTFEIQGHRGARGYLPENSIPGFVLALEQGAEVLEFDLCVSRDSQLVVNHEPWLNKKICLDPQGNPIENEDDWKLFSMDMETIRGCDCGSLGNPRFPTQVKRSVSRPALWEVVQVAEMIRTKGDSAKVRYNIEIKFEEGGEGIYHPTAEQFASLVIGELLELGIYDRTTVQSFSAEVLEALHALDPKLSTSWLVEDDASAEEQLARLSFVPTVFSPDYSSLSADDIDYCHANGTKVIPWTVNDQADMISLIELGVDGIITDFPKELAVVVGEKRTETESL